MEGNSESQMPALRRGARNFGMPDVYRWRAAGFHRSTWPTNGLTFGLNADNRPPQLVGSSPNGGLRSGAAPARQAGPLQCILAAPLNWSSHPAMAAPSRSCWRTASPSRCWSSSCAMVSRARVPSRRRRQAKDRSRPVRITDAGRRMLTAKEARRWSRVRLCERERPRIESACRKARARAPNLSVIR